MNSIAEQLDSWLGTLNGMLSQLWGLPYLTVVFILCFSFGLVLKYSKWFPDEAIPFAVIVLGGVFAPLLADPRADTLPLRIWVAKNIVVGMIVGMGTWAAHKFLVKPLAERFPWLAWLSPKAEAKP